MDDNGSTPVPDQSGQQTNLRETLPVWITKFKDAHSFGEFLRSITIYDKSEQYICWIMKSYAELAHKYRIDLEHFNSYVARYAANKNIVQFQVESNVQSAVNKVMEKLTKENHALYDQARKSIVIFDPDSPERYFFQFETKLRDIYSGIEEHIERAFPDEAAITGLGMTVHQQVWDVTDWKDFGESWIDGHTGDSGTRITKFFFPDNSSLLVYPLFVAKFLNLLKNKVYFLVNIIKKKNNKYFADLIVFLNKSIPDTEVNGKNFLELVREPIKPHIKFWMVLCHNLKKYAKSADSLRSFYQAVCLVESYAKNLEDTLSADRKKDEDIEKLWSELIRSPELYTAATITIKATSMYLDKTYPSTYSQFIAEAISRYTGRNKDGRTLMRIRLNDKEYFYVNTHLAEIFIGQLEELHTNLKKHYLSKFQKEFKEGTYNEDILIRSGSEYLKDVYRKTAEEAPEFYALFQDHKKYIIDALTGHHDAKKFAEWKDKYFPMGVSSALNSLDILLGIPHETILEESEAFSPLLKTFPFLKKLLFFLRGFGSKRGEKKKKAGKKKGGSLVAEAFENVISSSPAPPPKRNRRKMSPGKVEHKSPPSHSAPSNEEISQQKQERQKKLDDIKKSLFGNKNIMEELKRLEKVWNKTLEQDDKKKKQVLDDNKRYVVGIISSHTRNLRMDLQSIEKVAHDIAQDKQFLKIKHKDALEEYIRGYVILVFQKRLSK